jgi:hypothetical protein
MKPRGGEVALDVGGYPGFWTAHPPFVRRIDCLNVHEIAWDGALFPGHRIRTLVGNGCRLSFGDGSYDLLYSNSVIEHVGGWEQQEAFAREARRVGRRLWIQTPAFECPIEPHYIAPFVHFLPRHVQKATLRWFTPWGWLQKPGKEQVRDAVDSTRLLGKREMHELFPDCEIVTERLAGLLPKSYIAIRQ